jgi:hypothetical protein
MKKAMVVALMLASTNVFAFYEDPKQQFDMTSNSTNNVTIVFRQSKNVTQECSQESVRRGNKPFGFSVDACSYWDRSLTGPDQCLIITGLTTNFHTIGHEVRHCLQGNFHK